MQGRELPRIVVAEPQPPEVQSEDEPPRRSRFARLDFVRRPRRVDWFRLTLGCLLVGAALLGVGYFGLRAMRNAVIWLHARPKYQLKFSNIELVPHAPEWILGGDQTVLQGVLRKSNEDPVLSIPTLEIGRLTEAFKKSPWVQDVREIRVTYPNHVVAELRFREPVAAIELPTDGRWIVLDDHGVILPYDEIDTEKVAVGTSVTDTRHSLIRISRWNKTKPRQREPGVTWRTNPIDVAGTEADARILSAARLAGFLRSKERSLGPRTNALQIDEIHTNEGQKQGLIVFTSKLVRILWGPGPGEESPGSLDAERKWAIMRDWAEAHPQPALGKEDITWVFQKDGMIPVSPPSSAH